ncbi:MAG TPA: DUF72 domain-containing protein [Chitinophagaceae bacterium]|jgi:uncharacterized protein YecE (DUF72 family)|nr:DUF72 domain-containing protein [Chitinophagaceae bacterium]
MIPQLHIGTSGWVYKHWKNDFYPSNLPVRKWLEFYESHFGATEINRSFYRLPSLDAVQNWSDTVRPGFVFCPKMSRFLTHMKKLRQPEEPLERFFGVFEPLKEYMGPVLIQLPPMVKFNYDVAEHFFGLLHKVYSEYEFVLEVRHPTWLEDDALNLMAKNEVGLVISHSGNHFPYSEMVTAKNVYIRFHGPAELFASGYAEEELAQFATKIKNWIQEGHKVWAFFNNDIHGYAPKDALRLRALCEGVA